MSYNMFSWPLAILLVAVTTILLLLRRRSNAARPNRVPGISLCSLDRSNFRLIGFWLWCNNLVFGVGLPRYLADTLFGRRRYSQVHCHLSRFWSIQMELESRSIKSDSWLTSLNTCLFVSCFFYLLCWNMWFHYWTGDWYWSMIHPWSYPLDSFLKNCLTYVYSQSIPYWSSDYLIAIIIDLKISIGPRIRWPILGHLLHLNTTNLYPFMDKLRRKYGPIFQLQLGSWTTIVLTDCQHIKQFFNQPEFSYRPSMFLFNAFSYNGYGKTFFVAGSNVLVNKITHISYQTSETRT